LTGAKLPSSTDSIPRSICATVFERIAEHPINRIEELLPWNIGRCAEQQRQAA